MNGASLSGSFPSSDFGTHPELRLDVKKVQNLPLGAAGILLGTGGKQVKVDLLGMCLVLLERFADKYKSLNGFLELDSPMRIALVQLDVDRLPGPLRVGCYSSVLNRELTMT